MKRCWVHLYVGGAKVHSNRQYVVVLDFDTPQGLRLMEQTLNELAYSLAKADGARQSEIVNYYLAVHDFHTNTFEFHWPAKDLGE